MEAKTLESITNYEKCSSNPERLISLANFDVFHIKIPGNEALNAWEYFRATAVETGMWPLVLGRYQDVVQGGHEIIDVNIEKTESGIENLELDKWFEHRKEETSDSSLPKSNVWPEKPFKNDLFTIPLQATGKPWDWISIAFFPLKFPWEVAFFLDDPTGKKTWASEPRFEKQVLHAAMMKRWHERFGAEIVGHSSSTKELSVSRKPETKTEAVELAWECYYYAPDIFYDQNILHEEHQYECIEDFAASLMESDIWWIWWD